VSRIELIRRAAVRAANELWARAEQLWAHMEQCSFVRYNAEVQSVKKLTRLVHLAVEAEERCVCITCQRPTTHAHSAPGHTHTHTHTLTLSPANHQPTHYFFSLPL
jgi:hypothetical protein